MLTLVQVTFQELLNFWKFREVLVLLIMFQKHFFKLEFNLPGIEGLQDMWRPY